MAKTSKDRLISAVEFQVLGLKVAQRNDKLNQV